MTIGGAKVKTLEYDAIYSNGDSGTTKTIDWDNGNCQSVTMTDNCTFTFSNPLRPTLRLFVSNGGSVYAATWPGTVVWKDNTAPTFTANRMYICDFFYDGTNYYAQGAEYY